MIILFNINKILTVLKMFKFSTLLLISVNRQLPSIYIGVIIGKGWATAPNVTSEFRKISIGSIPYQDLPKVPLLGSHVINQDSNFLKLLMKCRYIEE